MFFLSYLKCAFMLFFVLVVLVFSQPSSFVLLFSILSHPGFNINILHLSLLVFFQLSCTVCIICILRHHTDLTEFYKTALD